MSKSKPKAGEIVRGFWWKFWDWVLVTICGLMLGVVLYGLYFWLSPASSLTPMWQEYGPTPLVNVKEVGHDFASGYTVEMRNLDGDWIVQEFELLDSIDVWGWRMIDGHRVPFQEKHIQSRTVKEFPTYSVAAHAARKRSAWITSHYIGPKVSYDEYYTRGGK